MSELTATELSKWGDRLAASDWSWVTWKYFLLSTGSILLWLIFLFVFISMFMPTMRKRYSKLGGYTFSGGSFVTAFICTWLVATITHGAVFSAGPYSYWLQTWVGADSFVAIEQWSFKYLTLLGLITGH